MSVNQNSATLYSLDLLWGDLKRKFVAPKKSLTFYASLVFAVITCGGAGIWKALFFQSTPEGTWDLIAIATALSTYYPAIVAPALIEFTHEDQPYLRSFGLLSLVPFGVLFALALMSEPRWGIGWAAAASTLAILFWWVANGEKDFFRDVVKQDDPTGGDVKRDLMGQGPEGWKE